MSFAGDSAILASSNITNNAPEYVSTPEINIHAEVGQKSGESGKGWLWVIVAILAVAGGVAIAGNGGGSGGSNNTGSMSVTW